MLAAAASRSFIPLPARPAGARISGVTTAGSASAWYVSRRGAILDSEDSILAAFSALTVFSFLPDRKSTRLNSSHLGISYAVFCLNDTATTEIYTLSLHDALPILCRGGGRSWIRRTRSWRPFRL